VEVYGTPVSVVHPTDNDFKSARYHPLLLRKGIKKGRRDELMQAILDLLALLQVGRDELGY